MCPSRNGLAGLCLMLGLISGMPVVRAQPAVAPDYAANYSLLDLGTPLGVSGRLGGLSVLPWDLNTLVIGGNANNPNGSVFAIGVERDADHHIIGFNGTARFYASAPEIDGGLAFGPGGVLFYTGYDENLLGQIKPGSVAPDKVIELEPLGITRSVGTLNVVPTGFGDAGELRIASYNSGNFYSARLVPDGQGTFDLAGIVQEARLVNGPEGLVYVPTGSALFPDPAMLVSEFGASKVSAFDVDAGANPIFATRRDFVTGLAGAEGGAIDPLSGDFLFSTFGTENRVIVVGGFAAPVPEPAPAALWTLGLLSLLLSRRIGRCQVQRSGAERSKLLGSSTWHGSRLVGA